VQPFMIISRALLQGCPGDHVLVSPGLEGFPLGHVSPVVRYLFSSAVPFFWVARFAMCSFPFADFFFARGKPVPPPPLLYPRKPVSNPTRKMRRPFFNTFRGHPVRATPVPPERLFQIMVLHRAPFSSARSWFVDPTLSHVIDSL